MKKNILIYPGFVIDTWSSIEKRYMWLDGPLKEYFNVFWLVPPAGSKYVRCRDEVNRHKEPIYVTELKKIGAHLIEADISKYGIVFNFFLLRKILRDYQIDAVTQWFSPLGYYLELTAKLCGVKVFRKEHNFTFCKERKYKLIKFLFWKWTTSSYMANSKSVANHLVEKRLANLSNVQVVYNAFDIETYPPPQPEESRRIILSEFSLSEDVVFIGCVSKIDKSKQQHLLIDMISRLCNKKLVLLLVGQPSDLEYTNQLKKQTERLGLLDKVIFMGYRFDIPKILDACEITYLPSQFEGLPNVVIESFIMSTPVIGSDIPSIREIIDDGSNGYLVTVGGVEALCQRTQELLASEEKRRRFGINGRKKAEQLFSKKTFIEESVKSFKKAFEYCVTT